MVRWRSLMPGDMAGSVWVYEPEPLVSFSPVSLLSRPQLFGSVSAVPLRSADVMQSAVLSKPEIVSVLLVVARPSPESGLSVADGPAVYVVPGKSWVSPLGDSVMRRNQVPFTSGQSPE